VAALLVEKLTPSRFGEKETAIMQWYALMACAVLPLLIGIGIGIYAYRLGLKRGRSLSGSFRLTENKQEPCEYTPSYVYH